jgi:methylmalonyl-CoA mutase cobalamin-binding subunit
LYKLGVSKVFGPGTNIPEAAIEIMKILWYFNHIG